ncbi:2Fe-2S iron-sulfur cluster-binding protein [Chitinophagales bacterium]|nr:2Fe-2S iron-sulfur cluster-binding protein [Chitinophagales bacterium]
MSDINILIKDRKGKSHSIKAPVDISMNLMEVIRLYELAEEGTIGICGGMAMCASCQCYIKSSHPLPELEAEEEAMLSEAFHVKENSRLSCQININSELNGLSLEIAPE